MQEFRGTGVALVTPFKKDLSVDTEALTAIVQHCIFHQVDYLVVLGTTGESATLTPAEKDLVIATVIDANAGKLPLMLGVGGNNTVQVVEELQTRDLSAFAGILSVSPYYNRPTQAGIYAHYSAIAEATDKPIMLYNVPGRTGSDIAPATTLSLARGFKNIIGIKEAKGDIAQVMKLIKDRPEGFLVVSGDDMLALPTVLAGGDGVISVLGQGIPQLFVPMINSGLKGDVKAAYANHYQLMDGVNHIFAEGNPAGIKALLAAQGLCHPIVRLPLLPATVGLSQTLATYFEGLRL
ncbi:MAG: 4-hydroxy-tetrahydrodipicolinate synthase [Leeuwenhoekiella sp.]